MDFCEFLAEEELIDIIPKFAYRRKLNLISGDFGPFQPGMPVKVPLWLAINLQKQHKCHIVIPVWVKNLMKAVETQKDAGAPIDLPNEHWREIMKILEQYCELGPGAGPGCTDMIERREAMLRKSAHDLMRHVLSHESLIISDVYINGMTAGELQAVKKLVTRSFNLFQKLRMLAHQASAN